jgi:hypothetical protein
LAEHQGPVWLLTGPGDAAQRAQALLADAYGLQPAGACLAWVNGLAPALLCPQRRVRAVAATTCPRPAGD